MRTRILRPPSRADRPERDPRISMSGAPSTPAPAIRVIGQTAAREAMAAIEYPLEDSWRRFNPQPIRVLNGGDGGGIPVYDAGSIQTNERNLQPEVPRHPKVLKMDQVLLLPRMSGTHQSTQIELRDRYALYCHGYVRYKTVGGIKVKYWSTADEQDIQELVARIQSQGVDLSVLLVCNPGGVRLKDNPK